MRWSRLVLLVLGAACLIPVTSRAGADRARPRKEEGRYIHQMGFRGHVAIRQLADDRVEVEIRTARGTNSDTLPGHAIFPILVRGVREHFYFGRLGASQYPMLLFAVTDPERVQDSRVISYQVTPSGALIGQQVLVDQSTVHGHSNDLTAGRYQLAAVDPELGAVYSVAYQDARFDGFFVSFEKLRVRQWDPTINAFIETDQGFLRERGGKLVETSRFHLLSDRAKEALFRANLVFPRPRLALPKSPRPVTARK